MEKTRKEKLRRLERELFSQKLKDLNGDSSIISIKVKIDRIPFRNAFYQSMHTADTHLNNECVHCESDKIKQRYLEIKKREEKKIIKEKENMFYYCDGCGEHAEDYKELIPNYEFLSCSL